MPIRSVPHYRDTLPVCKGGGWGFFRKSTDPVPPPLSSSEDTAAGEHVDVKQSHEFRSRATYRSVAVVHFILNLMAINLRPEHVGICSLEPVRTGEFAASKLQPVACVPAA